MLPTHQSLFLVLLSLHSISSKAQSTAQTVQDDWVAPAGPDNFTTIDIGQQYGIQWTGHLFSWFPIYDPEADVTNVDLWVTGYYQHQFAHLVGNRVNINATQTFFWGVQIPASELAATPYWVFRFLASGHTFNETSQSISSPGFIILNKTAAAAAPASTTSAIPKATPASADISSIGGASARATASGTSVPQSTTTPAPGASSSSSLSTGVMAGAGIGAAIAAILLIAIGYYFARRKQSSSSAAAAAAAATTTTTTSSSYAPPAYNNTSPDREYPEVAVVQKPGNYHHPHGSYYNQNPIPSQPHPQSQYQNVPYGHGPFSQIVQVPIAEMEHQDRHRSSGPAELDTRRATVHGL